MAPNSTQRAATMHMRLECWCGAWCVAGGPCMTTLCSCFIFIGGASLLPIVVCATL